MPDCGCVRLVPVREMETDMIKWHDKLYMDSVVAEKPDYYKNIAEDDSVHIPPVYCVTIPSNGNNVLDIVSCNELIFKHYRRNLVEVVGLTHSYKEAVQVVMSIALEAYNENDGQDINGSIRRKLYGNPA